KVAFEALQSKTLLNIYLQSGQMEEARIKGMDEFFNLVVEAAADGSAGSKLKLIKGDCIVMIVPKS
ncbi:MAG: hypothetical protein MHPSP_003331, partial [Paramarteilia canceri]